MALRRVFWRRNHLCSSWRGWSLSLLLFSSVINYNSKTFFHGRAFICAPSNCMSLFDETSLTFAGRQYHWIGLLYVDFHESMSKVLIRKAPRRCRYPPLRLQRLLTPTRRRGKHRRIGPWEQRVYSWNDSHIAVISTSVFLIVGASPFRPFPPSR